MREEKSGESLPIFSLLINRFIFSKKIVNICRDKMEAYGI